MGRKAKAPAVPSPAVTVEGRYKVELVLTLEVTATTEEEAKEAVRTSRWTVDNSKSTGSFISLKGKKVTVNNGSK